MSAPSCPSQRRSLFGRLGWRSAATIVAALLVVVSVVGIFIAAPAKAAVVSLNQCNNRLAGPGGATTRMNCTITVVNTINRGLRSSVVTASADCALDACADALPSSQSFTDVVTSIKQCNGSDTEAAPTNDIKCNVNVTNFISADTPGANPVTAATVNQCVGSGEIVCTPTPASTTNATVTQCNGSGTGGGGRVNCTVLGSTISPAIPIQINQCNGTGTAGGTIVTCLASIATYVTGAAVAPTTTPARAARTTAPAKAGRRAGPGTVTPNGGSGPVGPNGFPNGAPSTAPALLGVPFTPSGIAPTVPQVAAVPTGPIAAGGGSTAGLQHILLLTVSMGLLLAAGFSSLLLRRFLRGR